MIVVIDRAGRLVIPKAIREKVGLVPGEPLEVSVHNGRVEIVPAPRAVRIVQSGGLSVAEPAGSYQPLDEETVRRTRDRVRDRSQ